MFKAELSNKSKVILLALLVILNFVLRIPSIPHEKGVDSFFIHTLANSITSYGMANWWINWLSVLGLYPFSYASAIPFSLSGIAQVIGLNSSFDMEKIILLFSIIIGLFSIFAAYVFAGTIYEDFLSKYLMSFFFSISQGIMIFSTWEMSSRGPFIILLPLFIFILLKKMHYLKKIVLLSVLGLFLFATHHFFYFLIPLTLLFITFKILSKIRILWINYTFLNILYLLGLTMSFLVPFFLGTTFITAGSRYDWLLHIAIINTRLIGPIIFFIFGGLTYLILKNNKKFEEWYILCAFFLFIPFIYDLKYGQYILLLFSVFLISVSFKNLLVKIKLNKLVIIYIIFNLLLFVSFSAFYNHERTGNLKDLWYMDESTYNAGTWINAKIDHEKRVLSGAGGHKNLRIMALQDGKLSILKGGTVGLTHGYIDEKFINDNLQKVPLTSSNFYSEGAYEMTEADPYKETTIDWNLKNKNIKIIKNRYNMDYFVYSYYGISPIGLTNENSETLYTNGVIRIYDMRLI